MHAVDDPGVFAAVFSRSRALLAVLGLDGALLDINRLGAASGSLVDAFALGRPPWELDGWSAPALPAAVRRAAAGESMQCELEVQRDGSRRWFELSVSPLPPGRLLLEGHDITAWKLREQLAQQADTQYRAVVDTQTEIVSRFRPDGTLVFVNDAYCAFVGHPRAALLGQRWQLVAYPDDLPHIRRELEHMSPAAPIVVIENRVYDGEQRLRWMEFVNRGFYDPTGALVETQSIGRDITLRKEGEAERQRADRSFQTWQKLESLGQLAGGLAHDFSAVLTSVMTNAALARHDLLPGSAAAGCLDEIEGAAGRAAQLCRLLRDYAGQGSVASRRVGLNALLSDSLPLLRSARPDCALNLELGPGLPPIEGDPTQLQQIALNLVLNTGDPNGERRGLVTLRTRRVRVDRAALQSYFLGAEMDADDYVELLVRDDGPGLSSEALAHIFEPSFSSLRAHGRGRGLAATLGLVRAHRGAFRVESEPGRGTSFEVLLPRARASLPALGLAPEPAPAVPDTVLVIDGDESVRDGLLRVLGSLGRPALPAGSAAEAHAQLAAHGTRVACLLLDPGILEMADHGLLRELQARHPGIPTILMSGPADLPAQTIGCTIAGHLQKPFHPAELQALLRAVAGPPATA